MLHQRVCNTVLKVILTSVVDLAKALHDDCSSYDRDCEPLGVRVTHSAPALRATVLSSTQAPNANSCKVQPFTARIFKTKLDITSTFPCSPGVFKFNETHHRVVNVVLSQLAEILSFANDKRHIATKLTVQYTHGYILLIPSSRTGVSLLTAAALRPTSPTCMGCCYHRMPACSEIWALSSYLGLRFQTLMQ